jgi:hypothetical protein
LRVFIGQDPREMVVSYVCAESILAHSSVPVSFTFLRSNNFGYVEAHSDGSNAFTYSRFLVPHLCGFNGSAVFLDGDMILRDDIAKLWNMRSVGHVGVQVVKHQYETKYPTKYLGAKNESYPMKNWSSVMLWNCGFFPNRALTPEFVASAPGKYLHRFEWLADHQVGELPKEWNWLVREYEPNHEAKLLHYTIGAPCFPEYSDGDEAQEWFKHHAAMKEPM